MVYNPVASSLIARIGYDPDLKLLGVSFHDGKVSAIAPVTAEEFAGFMAAPSKGTHFYKTFGQRAKLGTQPAAAPIALREPEPLGPLETFHHDDCCSRRLQKADRTGLDRWECPKCGCEWVKVTHGPVHHWEPEVVSFVLPVFGR